MAKKDSLALTKRVAETMGIDDERLALILAQVPDGPIDSEIAQFLYQVGRTGLDPLSRQIYLVARYDKRQKRNVGQVQTGIDGYRLVAERTGKYAGSADAIFDGDMTQFTHKKSGEKFPVTATVTVMKALDSGVLGQFTATAEWEAYYPGDSQGFMWRKMPYVMLSKCAEALALRKAFPAELSGVYTAEEMMQAGGDDEDVKQGMLGALKIENANALFVMEKLDAVDISDDDEDLVAALGCPVGKVEDSAFGNKKLNAVWEFAVAIKKGTDRAHALLELTQKLTAISE